MGSVLPRPLQRWKGKEKPKCSSSAPEKGKPVLRGFPDSFEKDPIMHLESVYAHRGSFISRMMEKREDIARIILLREPLTLIAPAVR